MSVDRRCHDGSGIPDVDDAAPTAVLALAPHGHATPALGDQLALGIIDGHDVGPEPVGHVPGGRDLEGGGLPADRETGQGEAFRYVAPEGVLADDRGLPWGIDDGVVRP